MSRLVVFWVSLLYSLLSLAAGLAAKILRFLAEIQFVCCLFRLWCDESPVVPIMWWGSEMWRVLGSQNFHYPGYHHEVTRFTSSRSYTLLKILTIRRRSCKFFQKPCSLMYHLSSVHASCEKRLCTTIYRRDC
jgi:hypothetical protein